ncbi:MAG: M23 family metallopeptidase [Cytophagales bacterium]|nr:M23 family metallopeptidase [Cytophagales bacterium]
MKTRKKAILGLVALLILGLLIPQRFSMPVKGATKNDYNQESFWYYPWGKSGNHKGVDIFAKKGTDLSSSTSGFVLYAGNIDLGGNVVVILGPKWRMHYYAHLNEITTSIGWQKRGGKIGTVGDSGNARGIPAHLHYSILTPIPHFWRITKLKDWKKMFYLNPITYLNSTNE